MVIGTAVVLICIKKINKSEKLKNFKKKKLFLKRNPLINYDKMKFIGTYKALKKVEEIESRTSTSVISLSPLPPDNNMLPYFW